MDSITITGYSAGEAVNELIGWAEHAGEYEVGMNLQTAAEQALGAEFFDNEDSFTYTAPKAQIALIWEALAAN